MCERVSQISSFMVNSMPRQLNRKCQHCATLSAEEAQTLHGADGDDCWNPSDFLHRGYDCHRRRSHYRYREDNNRSRRRARKTQKSATKCAADLIEITPLAPPVAIAAVLVLYRQHKNAPVHAVAAEVWSGSNPIAGVKPVHCMGMRGNQVKEYIQEILELLTQEFGVTRFEDIVKEVPVQKCPIQPCPLKS